VANSLAAVEEEAVDVAVEVDEVARLVDKEEAGTLKESKRGGSRAELKVLLAFLKADPLISMAGNGNRLSEWNFWCGLLVGGGVFCCFLLER
jgi:hypothetical protein